MEQLVTVADGTRLWCHDRGAGPAVVLCHGGPGLWDTLAPLEALLPDGMRTVRWEQRGCGRSDRVGPYAVATTLADLDELREHLGIDRWIAAGHSFGATIALHHALERPDRVRALVLVDGVGIGRAWNRAYHEAADRRLSPEQRARREALEDRDRTEADERERCALAWTPDFADPTTAADLATAMARSPFLVNREANAAINAEVRSWDEEALAARCRALDRPVLVVHGSEDPRPAWAVDSLAAALPDVEVHVVAGAGHHPWVEAPDEVRRILGRFLTERGLVG